MRWIGLSLTLALGLVLARTAEAQQCCGPTQEACCGAVDTCGHCGCHAPCQKMCKVVCDVKEVKKTIWTVKCEDFCAPLPGCKRCHACGECGDCGACGGCEAGCDNGNCGKPQMVPPQCGPVRCKKTLVAKEVVEKVPVYKCVPCYACGGCCEAGVVQPMPVDPKAPALKPAPAPVAPKAPAAPKATGKQSLNSSAPLPPLMNTSYNALD